MQQQQVKVKNSGGFGRAARQVGMKDKDILDEQKYEMEEGA